MLTNPNGQVLQRPLRDGTTRCLFEPLDFLSGLAALVPRPRAHLTHYHGAAKPPPHPSFGVTGLGAADGHSPFRFSQLSPWVKERLLSDNCSDLLCSYCLVLCIVPEINSR